MPTRHPLVRSKRTFLQVLVVTGLVLISAALATAVFAGWTTIDVTLGLIDSSWGAASYTDANDNPAITNRDEIKNGWVRYDGTYIYFRIETLEPEALSSSISRRAVGAIDCNNDGDFTDPKGTGPEGDRLVVFTRSGVPTGTVDIYDPTLVLLVALLGDQSDSPAGNANIEWRVPLEYLYPGCRGSASPIRIGWGIGTGLGSVIDQSTVSTTLSNPMDYGDTAQTLPEPGTACGSDTATGLQCNGARHGIVPMTPGVPLRLGSADVDADPGNLQNSGSDADDTSGTTPDDEGGIAPVASDAWNDGGGQLSFQIVGAASARLGCWVDFNKNGAWTDAGETLVNNVALNSSFTTYGVSIPGALSFPNEFPVRCRIWQNVGAGTPTPVPAPSGAIEFGEVEDHIWRFDAGGLYLPPAAPSAVIDLAAAAPGGSDVVLTWTNPSPNDGARVKSHPTNPYFVSSSVGAVPESTVTAAPWTWPDAGHYGVVPAETIYYIVLGLLGDVEAAPSNRVGLFEFGLTKGTP